MLPEIWRRTLLALTASTHTVLNTLQPSSYSSSIFANTSYFEASEMWSTAVANVGHMDKVHLPKVFLRQQRSGNSLADNAGGAGGEVLERSSCLVCPRWSSERFKWPLLSWVAEWAPAKVPLPSAQASTDTYCNCCSASIINQPVWLLQLFDVVFKNKKLQKIYIQHTWLVLKHESLLTGLGLSMKSERSPPGSSSIAAARVQTLHSDSLQPWDSKCIQLHCQYSVIKFPCELSTESVSCVSPH